MKFVSKCHLTGALLRSNPVRWADSRLQRTGFHANPFKSGSLSRFQRWKNESSQDGELVEELSRAFEEQCPKKKDRDSKWLERLMSDIVSD